MNAVQNAVPAATGAVTLPLILTIAIATLALVGVALYLRRARRDGRLTGIAIAASSVSAAGILASALLVSVTLGGATVAAAEPAAPASTGAVTGTTSVTLTGVQLPTK